MYYLKTWDHLHSVGGDIRPRPLHTCPFKKQDLSLRVAVSSMVEQQKTGSTKTGQQQAQQKSTTTTTTSTSSKSKSSTLARKAEAVLTKDDIGRVIDLGLGRGVDATDPKPWLNKTSFQVRNITIENIIGTEEGGALQCYEREITNVHTTQADLKSSIAFPQAPISIGVDAEQSRGYSTTRRAVGKIIINRKVSFRADFEDVPLSRETDPEKARAVSSSVGKVYGTTEQDSNKTVADAQCNLTFEERLAKWIRERMLVQREMEEIALASAGKPIPSRKLGTYELGGINPVADLAELIRHSTEADRKELVNACHDFVYYFRITHFVSAIELGASEYRVLSESEYYSRIGIGGVFGVEALANTVTRSSSWKKTKAASDVKRVGKIYNEAVERGSYDEAVVGVDIQPITKLVKLRYLQLALRKAILDYMDEQGDTSDGPFLISCNNDTIFWSVNPENNYAVEATRNISNASVFYVIPNDDGKHPYEFIIGYYGDNRRALRRTSVTLSPAARREVDPIPRYLSAPVNTIGTNRGPLHLKFTVNHYDSRLTLQSRLVKGHKSVDTSTWVNGREAFYINCAHRTLQRDGYICVKSRPGRRNGPELFTACVPSRRHHNDRNVWMLFRLLPASHHDMSASTFTDGNHELDSSAELKEYEQAVSPDRIQLGPPRLHRKKDELTHSTEPEDTRDTFKLLDPRGKHLDTSGGKIPPIGAAVDLPELRTSDPTDVKITTVTAL